MLNKIFLEGRIAHDFEIKRTRAGKAITTISLAVNRDYKDRAGEIPCDFFDCVFFDKKAELASQFLSKGSKIIVVGRMQKRKWVNKDGDNRWTTEVLVSEIYFNNCKKENEDGYASAFEEDENEDGELPW